MPQTNDGNEGMQQLANRIRAELVRKGWSQGRLEDEAGFAPGSLTRILKAKQRRVWPQTLSRLAKALNMAPEELAGPMGREGHPGEPVGIPLSEIPGYHDAEVEVARLEEEIPLAVFQMARKTRLAVPPEVVTVELLRDHVRFLDQHVSHVSHASHVRLKTNRDTPRARPTKKRRTRAG